MFGGILRTASLMAARAVAKKAVDRTQPQEQSPLLNARALKAAMPYISNANVTLYLQPLNDTMLKYDIVSPRRIAHFLAQIGHESASFKYREEIASGKAYDTGRLAKVLGNTPEADGDGQRYKGRGAIQITGRSNYEAYARHTGIDVVGHPELLAEDPFLYIDCAGWFWNGKQLNHFADADDIVAITKRINGGVNGLSDRRIRLSIAKKALVAT